MSSRAPTVADPPARPAGEPLAVAAGRQGELRDGALAWTVHPAAEQPGRTLLVLGVVGLAVALTASVSGSAASTGLACLVLLGSLRAWFLPRTYTLDAHGASERGPLQACRRIAWADVRAVRRERHGIHVSPLACPSARVRDRGLFLRLDDEPGRAERVTAFLAQRRGA